VEKPKRIIAAARLEPGSNFGYRWYGSSSVSEQKNQKKNPPSLLYFFFFIRGVRVWRGARLLIKWASRQTSKRLMDVSQGSTDPWSHGAMGAGTGPENRARITRYQGECASGCAAKLLNEICRGHPHASNIHTHTLPGGQTDSHMRHKGLIVHSCKLFGCHRQRLSQLGHWELPSN